MFFLRLLFLLLCMCARAPVPSCLSMSPQMLPLPQHPASTIDRKTPPPFSPPPPPPQFWANPAFRRLNWRISAAWAAALWVVALAAAVREERGRWRLLVFCKGAINSMAAPPTNAHTRTTQQPHLNPRRLQTRATTTHNTIAGTTQQRPTPRSTRQPARAQARTSRSTSRSASRRCWRPSPASTRSRTASGGACARRRSRSRGSSGRGRSSKGAAAAAVPAAAMARTSAGPPLQCKYTRHHHGLSCTLSDRSGVEKRRGVEELR